MTAAVKAYGLLEASLNDIKGIKLWCSSINLGVTWLKELNFFYSPQAKHLGEFSKDVKDALTACSLPRLAHNVQRNARLLWERGPQERINVSRGASRGRTITLLQNFAEASNTLAKPALEVLCLASRHHIIALPLSTLQKIRKMQTHINLGYSLTQFMNENVFYRGLSVTPRPEQTAGLFGLIASIANLALSIFKVAAYYGCPVGSTFMLGLTTVNLMFSVSSYLITLASSTPRGSEPAPAYA